MADKSVKELATISRKDVTLLQKQLQAAGLGVRGEDDLVSDAEQEQLVNYLKESHGERQKSRISLKAKTTTTAQVTSISGKAKTINVVKAKKKVFEKPDPAKIAKELAEREAAAAAEAAAREQQLAAEAAKQKEIEDAKARQAETLAAMRAGSEKHEQSKPSASVVVKKGKATTDKAEKAEQAESPKKTEKADKKAKPKAEQKQETEAERSARLEREAEERRLKDLEAQSRRKAAEEAQKRTLEQMKEMASRYSDKDDNPATIVRKDEPLAKGLVGAALACQ